MSDAESTSQSASPRPEHAPLPDPCDLAPSSPADTPAEHSGENSGADAPTDETLSDLGLRRAAAKAREFPQKPGVYLLKDAAGRVIYVGKATNLRARAGSYFLKQAQAEPRTAYWIGEVCDADYIECDSEVDALLVESRLIKDTQPKYNKEQKDDKTFPYLMIGCCWPTKRHG